ncbi:hypothetical protein PACTADRAFT_48941 [Pachysolen tannophilus NRRL Y-2460]|uniref:Uncharacterized protein n=1 Tax=Pachysolen tannophilus NRRL Y-2460 TaxID=669874 RepID=A0A1E4TZM2_PACTA|nr:hypothetical protein PACTADRAFT_48941 [Pachysolen tannophilus NRRL Y-2460]
MLPVIQVNGASASSDDSDYIHLLGDIFSAITTSEFSLLILICLIYYFVTHILFYYLFGVSIGSVNVFFAKVNNVYYKKRNFLVYLRFIKVRFSPFDRNHKFINFLINGLELELNTAKVRNANKKGNKINNIDDDDISGVFNPISVYPQNNRKLKFFLKFFYKFFLPSIDVQLQNCCIKLKDTGVSFNVDLIDIVVDSSVKKGKTHLVCNSSFKLSGLKLIYQTEKINSINDDALFKLESLLDLNNGAISNIKSQLKVHSITVPIFTLLKCASAIEKIKHSKIETKVATPMETKHKSENDADSYKSIFHREMYWMSLVIRLIREIDIHLDNVSIQKIPFISQFQFAEILNDKFQDNGNLIYFELNFKSITATLSTLQHNHAGYDINFGKNDYPLQFIASMMQSKLILDFSSYDKYKTSSFKYFELVNVPSITTSIITNTFFQTLSTIKQGKKLSNGLSNLNCSISNLIVDISTKHLGIIISKALAISFDNKTRKHESTTSTNNTKSSNGSFIDYLYYVSNIWPQINFKFLIEKPTALLKFIDDNENTISMAVIDCSLINLEIFSSRKLSLNKKLLYTINSTCRTTNFSISYNKKIYNDELETTNHKDSYESRLIEDHTFLKSQEINFVFNLQTLPRAKFTSVINYNYISLDVSDLFILNGLCDLIADIDINTKYLSSDQILILDDIKTEHQKNHKEKNFKIDSHRKLFDYLPKWFESFKIVGYDLKLKVCSRSVLIPQEIIRQQTIPGILDNIDGSFRKISLSLKKWEFEIVNDSLLKTNKKADGTTTSSSIGSQNSSQEDYDHYDEADSESESELEKDSETNEYWKASLKLQQLGSSVYMEEEENDDDGTQNPNPHIMKPSKMLKIPIFDAEIKSFKDLVSSKNLLKIDLDCDELSVHYSLIKHFLIISSVHLLNNTLFNPAINRFKDEHEKQKSADDEKVGNNIEETKEGKISQVKTFLSFTVFEFRLHQFKIITKFAENFNLKFDGLHFDIQLSPGSPLQLRARLLRVLAKSVHAPDFWTRLSTVNSLKITFKLDRFLASGADLESFTEESLFEISNSSARVIIPHQFVIHRVFDQISVAVKTAKQLHHSLEYNSDELVIYPHSMKPLYVPKTRVKSKRIIFCMEDDPFESELNMIFQLGLIEQKNRMAKYRAFRDGLKEELNETTEIEKRMDRQNLNSSDLLSHQSLRPPKTEENIKKISKAATENLEVLASDDENKVFEFKRRNQSEIKFKEPSNKNSEGRKNLTNIAKKMEMVDEIDKKLFKLRKNISRSWYELVKDYKAKMEQQFNQNAKFLWGMLNDDSYPFMFNDKLLQYSVDPPLMNVILENFDLTLRTTKFPLSELPQYIHDIGKGVPLDTKYTLLLPVFLDMKVKELRVHLRDYPLPLVYIPAVSPDQRKKLSALRISGNLVIGEEFVERRENIRTIYVPLVPSARENSFHEYFGLEVPKTIASVKIFTELSLEINSKSATKFTLGQSYQPAIQQVMLNLDNFSKPQLDPSEKIGFWDKIRSIFHAKVEFNWNYGGNLLVCFKGSRSPYFLLGDSSGFVLSFKDNIKLNINEHDDPKEFLVVKANEVSWVIPNHLSEPLLVWSKETSKAVFIPESRNNIIFSMAGYYLDDDDPEVYSKKLIGEMSRCFIEKTVAKLSGEIRFVLGISFERKSEDEKFRTNNFKAHYEVVLSNPKFIPDIEHYDAYRGFRSDFIHMSIALSSSDEKKSSGAASYNSLHLSPRTFSHFFSWWYLFNGSLSVPIRHGKMFGPNKESKKFSNSLESLKFQFLISPLFLSHVYRNEAVDVSDEKSKVECVGLKAKIDTFSVDLHQMKESQVKHDKILDQTQKVRKMKMYLGEVDINNTDLRALRSLFKVADDSYDVHKEEFLEIAGLDPTYHSDIKEEQKTKLHVFNNLGDDDETWFDINDFEEVDLPSVADVKSVTRVVPLLFTPKFTYYRKTDDNNEEPGESEGALIHDCLMGESKSTATQLRLLKDRLKELQARRDSVATSNNASKQAILQKLDKGLQNVGALISEVATGKFDENNLGLSYESFQNKFLVHNMQLKWNRLNRNFVYKYAHFVDIRKAYTYYLKYQAFDTVEKIIREQKANYGLDSESAKLQKISSAKSEQIAEEEGASETDFSDINYSYDDISCSERLEKFDEDLRSINSKSTDKKFEASDNYLVKLISPQIQLINDDLKSDSCVLVVSPDIELKIVSIGQKTQRDKNGNEIVIDDQFELERRHGSVFRDTNIFVAYKEDVIKNSSSFFSGRSYGSKNIWPPWLGVELCHDGSSLMEYMVLEKTSFVLRYDKMNQMIKKNVLSDYNRNRIIVEVPKVAAFCDSKQYHALYNIIVNLLMYTEPSNKEMNEKLGKLILTTDFSNLNGTQDRIKSLQDAYLFLIQLSDNFTFKRTILNESEANQLNVVNFQKTHILSELFLLMRVITTGTTGASKKDEQIEWTIRSDEIILHMLDEKRAPFIDLAVAEGVFRRISENDGSNYNVVEVGMIQAFNLDSNILYPELLTSFNPKQVKAPISKRENNMLQVEWAMDKAVGGIKIIKNFVIEVKPIKLSLEQFTGQKFFEYIFPSDKNKSISKSSGQDESESDLNDEIFEDDIDRDSSISEDLDSEEMAENGLDIINSRSSEKNSQGVATSTGPTSRKSFNFKRSSGNKNDNKNDDYYSSGSSLKSSKAAKDGEFVNEMVKRASDYKSIVSLTIRSLALCINFKGEGGFRLINVNNLVMTLPDMTFNNKIWTTMDLVNELKKIVIKAVLHHSGSIVANKLTVHKKKRIKQPLRQITSYSSLKLQKKNGNEHEEIS